MRAPSILCIVGAEWINMQNTSGTVCVAWNLSLYKEQAMMIHCCVCRYCFVASHMDMMPYCELMRGMWNIADSSNKVWRKTLCVRYMHVVLYMVCTPRYEVDMGLSVVRHLMGVPSDVGCSVFSCVITNFCESFRSQLLLFVRLEQHLILYTVTIYTYSLLF